MTRSPLSTVMHSSSRGTTRESFHLTSPYTYPSWPLFSSVYVNSLYSWFYVVGHYSRTNANNSTVTMPSNVIEVPSKSASSSFDSAGSFVSRFLNGNVSFARVTGRLCTSLVCIKDKKLE